LKFNSVYTARVLFQDNSSCLAKNSEFSLPIGCWAARDRRSFPERSVKRRRLDVDTSFLRESGTIPAKDHMSVNDLLQIENQSEQKLDKVREPASKVAHALLK
jgi:hypothetical protein